MISLLPEPPTRLFVRPGYTDMRKSALTLAQVVTSEMQLDVFQDMIFLFRGRSARLIKILYWDRNGFCLWQKRLAEDRIPWPTNSAENLEISREDLSLLLTGVDFFRRHTEKNFGKKI